MKAAALMPSIRDWRMDTILTCHDLRQGSDFSGIHTPFLATGVDGLEHIEPYLHADRGHHRPFSGHWQNYQRWI
jgi:hypothetical protein